MQIITNIESKHSSINRENNYVSWWNPKDLNMNLSSACENPGGGSGLADPDSSSTQLSELSVASDGTFHGQSGSAQSGDSNLYLKSSICIGSTAVIYQPTNIGPGQPFACIPYPYADPYMGGIFPAHGSHTVIAPEMGGLTNSRVPLPLQSLDCEPIFVNPKQYHGILRRRQLRAKLLAQNKLARARKPYLHESRHLHAMRRARGLGGRFLNTKEQNKLQQNAPRQHSSFISNSSDSNKGGAGNVSQKNGIGIGIACNNHMNMNMNYSGELMQRWVSATLP